MRKRVPVQDVFAASVPEALNDPALHGTIPATLTKLAIQQVWNQYVGWEKPGGIEFEEIDWLITKDPVELEKFQPAHDCAACRAGNDQALTFLRENPGRYVALANICYVEVWG